MPSNSEPDPPSAEALQTALAAGDWAKAAQLARLRHEHARAAQLFERIWEFAEAAQSASAAGDALAALRLAALAKQPALIATFSADAVAAAGAPACCEVLANARQPYAAAELAQAHQLYAAAAEYYLRAHAEVAAARMYIALGNDRQAGLVLERFIAHEVETAPERGHAALLLGQILLRRLAYPEAARWLQVAQQTPAHTTAALTSLVHTLSGMGMREGAQQALAQLRMHVPATPATVEEFMRAEPPPALSPPAASSNARDVIGGRYHLQRLLGAGSAGRVFLAHDEITGREVAVKILAAAQSQGSVAYERFAREAQIAATLKHPSIVETFETAPSHGYLVMEFLPGGSLAERLRREGPLSLALVKRLAIEICEALTAAQQRGIVHRDIKPANIFFDARGTAKLGDFGVAHLLDLGQTQTGGMIGTLAYMAPEQITGAPIAVTADSYALGVTLFEALCGRLPFLGPDFIAQHLGDTAPAVSSLRPDAATWDELVARLLEKVPAARPNDFAALSAQLRAFATKPARPTAPEGPLTIEAHNADHAPGAGASASPPRPTVPPDAATIASEPPASASLPLAAQATTRYQFTTPLAPRAPDSQLARALDTVLNRTVIVETFDETAQAAITRALALAPAATPFVQRILAFDQTLRTAVFEAPSGTPLSAWHHAINPGDALRILKRLARALVALAVLPAAHGGIDADAIILDDQLNPLLLVAGTRATATTAGTHADPSCDLAQLLATLTPFIADAVDVAHLRSARDAEHLYALVDDLEIALAASAPTAAAAAAPDASGAAPASS